MAVIGVRFLEPAEARLPLLIQALDDPSPYVQSEASQALSIEGPRAAPAIPKLCKLLLDPDASRRRQAIQVIGRIGRDARDCVDSLEGIVKADPRKDVRESAARALREIRR